MATPKEHLEELLKAAPDDRAYVARALIESLDQEAADGDHETAWAAELTRRAEGIAKGSRGTVDGAEARARVLARLRSIQR